MLSHFLPQLDLFLDLVGLRVLHSKPATPKAIFMLVLFSSFLLLRFVVLLLLSFLPFLSFFPSFCLLFVVLLFPFFFAFSFRCCRLFSSFFLVVPVLLYPLLVLIPLLLFLLPLFSFFCFGFFLSDCLLGFVLSLSSNIICYSTFFVLFTAYFLSFYYFI